MPSRSLPLDSVLLPVSRGALLVSVGHVVFCSIPEAELDGLRAVLAGAAPLDSLSPALLAELERHGCFEPPSEDSGHGDPLVQIQLTNACNLGCTYCCTNSGPARAHEVGLDDIVAVLSATAEAYGPGTRVALLGGEPLLVPWALDAAERALALGLKPTLFSNGMPLLDPVLAERASRLVKGGLELRVSLAGPTRELCDEVSAAPRFDAVVAALHVLARHGVTPVVDLMLLPQHVAAAAESLPALRRALPKGTVIALGLAYRAGREEGEHLFGSRVELEAALDRIAFEAGESIRAVAPSPRARKRLGCACALGNHLHVRSDGALFTCFKMEERVGHLRDGFAAAIERVRAQPHPSTSLRLCAPCPLVTLCGGGCRSDNFLYTGDANEPVCGPWRVQVLCELLYEDCVAAVEWPAAQLLAEALRRGVEAPEHLQPLRRSTHVCE